MKKILILLAILPSFVFAQSNFTEATLNEMNVRFLQKPINFLKNETAQGFIYINSAGISNDLKNTMMIYEVADEPMREFTKVKIYQDGPYAYVEAILKHTIVVKKTQESRTLSEGILYTLVAKNGKWLLQTVHHSVLPVLASGDEAAIKKVIKDETDGYYEGNAPKVIEQWSSDNKIEYQNQAIIPYVGNSFAKGENMKKLQAVMLKLAKKQDIEVKNDDFEIRQRGDMAWATYSQALYQSQHEFFS